MDTLRQSEDIYYIHYTEVLMFKLWKLRGYGTFRQTLNLFIQWPLPFLFQYQKYRKRQQRQERAQAKEAEKKVVSYTLRVQDMLNNIGDEDKENFRNGAAGAVVSKMLVMGQCGQLWDTVSLVTVFQTV